jgi:NADH dehydrogenase FAD-containing subunit
MGTIHPCGHIEAQHLYHDSGELILDLSKCRAVVEGQPDAAELAVQMAQYLAHAVWAEWHGPLARIPNTGYECASQLLKMIQQFEELAGIGLRLLGRS